MGLYEELKSSNYAEVMVNDIARLKYAVSEEGIISSRPESLTYKMDSPWVWTGFDSVRLCSAWLGVYFSKYKFISRNCFNCWKVVLRLDKVTTLFKLLDLMLKMHEEEPERFTGKCGTEDRPYAKYKGRYAGFWYCSMEDGYGLDEARELAREIEVRVQKDLATGLKISLKRGCTEMEERFGPSNLWTYNEAHHEVENDLDELIDLSLAEGRPQPEWLVKLIKTGWMERAFETNDMSVKELVDHFPESFGIAPTAEYYKGNPKILCVHPTKGKTNAGSAKIYRI